MKEMMIYLVLPAAVVIAVFSYLRAKRLKNLADSFSAKYASLAKSHEEFKNRMSFVMDCFSSPFLGIDGEGKIFFANSEIKRLAGFPDMEGHNYLEFIKEPEFINALQEIHRNKKTVEKEIFIYRRIFLASFSDTGKSGDILVSFRDVTAERELERIKRELVTNMSHELKTPLTAIKGYAETLYDEIPGELKNYLDIIRKHTDRLIAIVNDILSLSELEEVQEREFAPVNIDDVIRDTAKIFEGRLKAKNLALILELGTEGRNIEGDRFKLEELFINLFDNAVRYSDKGSISVKSFCEGNFLSITIKDTGIGIPERSLPRIFERFYVVDRSRSKETGGTGLGLSIVKHIVVIHKGSMDIKSRPGAGTEIYLRFPLSG
ncbi:MAG TPA: ATP-binding protein [bacterium]|nr:ATP-binding protein [bacterium]